MKNIKRIIVLSMAGIVLFSACQSKKEKLTIQIAEAEKQLSTEYSDGKINQLVALYQEYVKEFPEDSTTAEYLFRSAEMSMRLRKGADALANLDAIINNFPDSPRIPESYFFKGFIYEDVLYDIESAKNAYREFLMYFPSHNLAADASLAIFYLGKSPEEIVASFNDTVNTVTK